MMAPPAPRLGKPSRPLGAPWPRYRRARITRHVQWGCPRTTAESARKVTIVIARPPRILEFYVGINVKSVKQITTPGKSI
jgi:hypothetical protein